MTPMKRRLPPTLLLTGAAFIAALLLIPWAVFAQGDSTVPTNLTAEILDDGVALSWDAPSWGAASRLRATRSCAGGRCKERRGC